MSYLPPVMQVLLAALVVTAAAYDLRYRRIPNWLVLSGLFPGLALNLLLYGLAGLRISGAGLGLALLIYFPLYLVRAMGAGDAKLMAAIGAIVGPWNWLGIFVASALLGGLMAVILLLRRGRLGQTLINVAFIFKELASLRPPYLKHEALDVKSKAAVTMPHGAAVAAGALGFLAAAAIWAPRA